MSIGSLRVTKLLVEKYNASATAPCGAGGHLKCAMDSTPLHLAVLSSSTEMVRCSPLSVSQPPLSNQPLDRYLAVLSISTKMVRCRSFPARILR